MRAVTWDGERTGPAVITSPFSGKTKRTDVYMWQVKKDRKHQIQGSDDHTHALTITLSLFDRIMSSEHYGPAPAGESVLQFWRRRACSYEPLCIMEHRDRPTLQWVARHQPLFYRSCSIPFVLHLLVKYQHSNCYWHLKLAPLDPITLMTSCWICQPQ